MLLALIGVYGAIRLRSLLLLTHSALVLGLIIVFILSFLATVLFGSGGDGSDDSAIIYVVFAFFLFDVVAAVYSLQLARGLVSYRRAVQDAGREGGRSAGLPPASVPPPNYDNYLAQVTAHDDAMWSVVAQSAEIRPRAQQVRQDLVRQRGAGGDVAGAAAPSVAVQQAPQDGPRAPAAGLGTCAVCLVQPVDTLLYDCGHVTCGACSIELCQRFGHCPFCRKRIRDTVPVFYP